MQNRIVFSVIVYGLLIAGLASLRGEFIALTLPFLLHLLYGFAAMPEKLDLSVERSLSADRVMPGMDVVVTLKIHNNGAGLDELLVEDNLPGNLSIRLGSPRHLIRLPQNSSHTFTYTVSAPRGRYRFHEVSLQTFDPFNLLELTRRVNLPEHLFVFPDIRKLRNVVIRPRRTRVYAGAIPAHTGGQGIEFFGVHEYQPGDSPRSINWRASARNMDSLYSNEYRQERVADVGIVLDARMRSNMFRNGNSIFDYSVLAAGTLADTFISQGNRVGLLVYGNYLAWTYPAYGKMQRERIMHALASASVGSSAVFAGLEHLPARMFPPESQIVLVSPLIQDDMEVLVRLRARGYQVLVVTPDPVQFEKNLLPDAEEVETAARIVRMERELFIRRLQRAGVHVAAWNVSIPFEQALGPLLMRGPVMGRVL